MQAVMPADGLVVRCELDEHRVTSPARFILSAPLHDRRPAGGQGIVGSQLALTFP